MLAPIDEIPERVFETDVCIAGGGPAGITLALALAKSGTNVVLLEGGGLAPPTPEEKSLYSGASSGRSYPLSMSRLRYFGGSSGHWGGWVRPLDKIDFARKPHIQHSGWPIDRSDMTEWYNQAHTWLEIPSSEYFEDQEPPFQEKLLSAKHGIVNRFFRFSPPTRYGSRYLEDVTSSKNLTCLLGANLTKLHTQNQKIESVTAVSLSGKEIEVRARYTVLATGGIENARILLNTAEHSKDAIGNHSDWLGRNFMDHPGWSPGRVISKSDLSYYRFDYDGVAAMPALGIADEVLMSEKTLNCCGFLHPVGFDKDIQKQYFRNPWFNELRGAEDIASYRLQLIFEPSPTRDSRLTLTNETDSLGIRKVDLHWAIDDSDFDMLARSIDRITEFFGVSGSGRMKLLKPVNNETRKARLGNGMHHMGTTRMSESANDGVVDINCAVHGMENLYIAGSSVFPTAGFSNPTLTIVALSCRMAAHLTQKLDRS